MKIKILFLAGIILIAVLFSGCLFDEGTNANVCKKIKNYAGADSGTICSSNLGKTIQDELGYVTSQTEGIVKNAFESEAVVQYACSYLPGTGTIIQSQVLQRCAETGGFCRQTGQNSAECSKDKTRQIGDSIILKIPITNLDNPSDPFSDHTITGYTDQIVKLNDEFSIDTSNINSGECAPKIKFRLDYFDENSSALSITAEQMMDGQIILPSNPRKIIINDGTCISVSPMCTDVSVEYCFELKKNQKGIIELYYRVELEGLAFSSA
jgi:hypothetical protein